MKSKFDYRILGSGEETIIVETGIGNSYYEWVPLANRLSEHFTVVLYHRLGYGQSAKAETKRTTYNIATELYEFINDLKIEKLILLAHSFGGLCAQHFALLYPEKISKLILLDSASERLAEFETLDTPFLNEHCSIKPMVSMNLEFSRKSREEIIESQERSINKNRELLSSSDLNAYIEFLTSSSFYKTVADEFLEWISDGEEIKKLRKPSTIDTSVICRDYQIAKDNWINNGVPSREAEIHERHWKLLQEELVDISSNSNIHVATGCDHMIHIENPELIYKMLVSN